MREKKEKQRRKSQIDIIERAVNRKRNKEIQYEAQIESKL